MAEFDIVVVHHGGNDALNTLALRCLQTVREHSDPGKYFLRFVDNGSPVRSAELEAEIGRHQCEVIRNPVNLGYTKATNQGLRESTAPYVVLLNNDAEAAPSWLETLKACLIGNIGIAGPRTDNGKRWQAKHWARTPYLLSLQEPMLAFFCVMLRREVIEAVGLFDEGYEDGLGSDDDYCRRALEVGFRLALAGNLVIPHRSRATFDALYTPEEMEAMQARAIDKFL